MKYEILQLNRNNVNVQRDGLMFMPWSYVDEKYGFNHWNYRKVYEGEIDDPSRTISEVLDDLFYIFNHNHPEGFQGHSLSVSDVVVLEGVKYYCDSCGWVNVKTGKNI